MTSERSDAASVRRTRHIASTPSRRVERACASPRRRGLLAVLANEAWPPAARAAERSPSRPCAHARRGRSGVEDVRRPNRGFEPNLLADPVHERDVPSPAPRCPRDCPRLRLGGAPRLGHAGCSFCLDVKARPHALRLRGAALVAHCDSGSQRDWVMRAHERCVPALHIAASARRAPGCPALTANVAAVDTPLSASVGSSSTRCCIVHASVVTSKVK